jgi:hypothetical protein
MTASSIGAAEPMQLQVVLRISRELGGSRLLPAFMVMPGNVPLCAGGAAISFVSSGRSLRDSFLRVNLEMR